LAVIVKAEETIAVRARECRAWLSIEQQLVSWMKPVGGGKALQQNIHDVAIAIKAVDAPVGH
jgi:hypothetical protein